MYVVTAQSSRGHSASTEAGCLWFSSVVYVEEFTCVLMLPEEMTLNYVYCPKKIKGQLAFSDVSHTQVFHTDVYLWSGYFLEQWNTSYFFPGTDTLQLQPPTVSFTWSVFCLLLVTVRYSTVQYWCQSDFSVIKPAAKPFSFMHILITQFLNFVNVALKFL